MSAALKRLTSGLDLVDSWKHMNHTVVDYTFVRGRSMSRIDKIYVSKSQVRNIRSATIQANCFSDHKAVITRVVLPASSRLCSRPIWRLNNTLLTDENMLELSQKWAYWKRFKQNYDSWLEWWVLFVKEKLARFFKWKQGIVTRRFQATMGFQYACLRRAYQQHLATDCTTEINRIKAVMLQTQKQFSTSRRPRNERFLCGENVSIFQLEEDLRRRSETTIRQMQHEGQQITEPAQIVEHVQQHFGRLFAREEVDQHTNFVPERRITNSRINDQLMDEIGEQEILAAIRASAPNKSPGRDGLTREFYLKMWPTIRIEITAILNEMKNGRMREDCTEGLAQGMQSASTRILINGQLSGAFNVRRSVRQGDPLSMLLFVVYLQPLLEKLVQICNGPGEAVVAYADDVTVILRDATKANLVLQCFREFGASSGAMLNLQKTVALKMGEVDVPAELTVKEEVKVLGITFRNNLKATIEKNWHELRRSLVGMLSKNRPRVLNMKQKVVLLNVFVCSKIL
ncbi:hypothetical protein quinque_002327 [Culex quinquefasciatus]